MNTLFWGLITLCIIAAVAVLIIVMIELRGAVRSLNEVMKTVKPTLEELQLNLRSVRSITDNITTVTEDVKVLSGSVKDVGLTVKQINALVSGVTVSTAATASGVRAGVKAAAQVLLKDLFASKGHRQ
ncbi:MAG TPA: hypothetical protein VFG09_08440 [Thermodesulfovibrionales bacterium]|nr:hypothetical protein [Thermodesulfovibrionales bacterium]